MYDPAIGRWTAQDPLSEKYYSWSQYNYCGANPVIRIDSEGKFWETAWDATSLTMGLKSLRDNIRQGKIGAAIADGIGVLLDVAAVATPFVPGGVSAAISAARTVDRVDDIVDVNKVTNTLTDVKGKRIQHNEGVAKPHGKADHNEVIDSIISDLKNDDNNKNIRKNQKQVDSQGNTVGNNRPDIQWDNNDVHHNLEVDRSIKNNNKHEVVIKKNDPNSIFHGKVL